LIRKKLITFVGNSTNVGKNQFLHRLISTEKVRVRELDGVIQLMPIKEDNDCTIGICGLFSEFPEMSVDKFLYLYGWKVR
jgi:hypothetical protein